ncbi:hypothetical protein JCM10212_003190 [Sporobolomyces blumeae]
MELWTDELSEAFAVVPWSSHSSPTSSLLLKLLYRPEPTRSLSLLATDLRASGAVYYETLSGRQLHRRVDDAVSTFGASQTDSIGVMAGVGPEGEALVDRTLDALVEGVRTGKARAELSEEGFEHCVDICLPDGISFRFVLFHLEADSASVLARHLIQPLIGTSSALLALLRQRVPDEQTLRDEIESSVDSSARTERLSEGKTCSTWFRVGGASILQRFEQSLHGIKLNRIEPVQLSLPGQRHSHPVAAGPVPSTSKGSPTTRPAPSSPRRISTPPRPASTSPSKRSGLAHQMLDHRSTSGGTKVRWEDSQVDVEEQVPGGEGKGKGREVAEADVAMRQGSPTGQADEAGEPSTDDEDDLSTSLPPSSQPRQTRTSLSPVSPPPKHRQRPSPSRVPPMSSVGRSNESFSPSPHRPEPSQSQVKKRKAAEQEEEALARRKAKFALLKGKGSGAPQGKAKIPRGL